MKPLAAAPPEFVAVTVTSSASGVSVGIVTRPAASIVAPAPATLQLRFSPVKSAAASTVCGPLPSSKISSRSAPRATGGA